MSTRLNAKPIPVITWRNMSPPFKDHVYFQHHQHYPFQADRHHFSPINAWWLSEAALLSYSEPDFAVPRLQGADFDEVRFFSGPSTQCYVAANRQFAVVAFRGTECDIGQGPDAVAKFITDLSVDINILWVDAPVGGKIHRGFHRALSEIWSDLQAYLKILVRRGCALWLTGHSLGGALAMITASRFTSIDGVYTFGAPRVGNRNFVSRIDIPLFRIVHNNDVVPHLPPFPYVDQGKLRYIDSKGRLRDPMGGWLRWKDEIQGHLQCLVENIRNLDWDLAATLPDGLKGHTPLLYALHLWNNLISIRNEKKID